MKPDAFRDRAVIVTGASAGIGKSLALRLAAQGAKVAIAARRAERLQPLAEECQRLGGQAVAIPTNITDESQCKALVDQTVEAFGGLDMLINNAGMAASALFGDFPDLSLFKQTLDVNFYGAVYCTYHALPHLKERRGRIVAVSSLGGKVTVPYNTPYCSSKFAMHGFYETLRTEVAAQGLSCTIICPWWVATEFHEAQLDKDGVARGARGRAYYTRRTMTSDQCAQIVLEAAFKRRREVLMGPGPLAVWLRLLAPGLLDWLTIKVFLEPAARRARAAQMEAPS